MERMSDMHKPDHITVLGGPEPQHQCANPVVKFSECQVAATDDRAQDLGTEEKGPSDWHASMDIKSKQVSLQLSSVTGLL